MNQPTTKPTIEPTVGRVVWLRGRHGSLSGSQPEVGFITYVHSNECINIAGFDANGAPFSCTSVVLDNGQAAVLPEFHAEWIPYQKGQAARHATDAAAPAATGG